MHGQALALACSVSAAHKYHVAVITCAFVQGDRDTAEALFIRALGIFEKELDLHHEDIIAVRKQLDIL